MRGVTCPKCGTMNATGRFSCVKCYAPLASPADAAKADEARSQRRKAQRQPGIPLLPTRPALSDVSPFEIAAAAVALIVLTLALRQATGGVLWVYFAAAALSGAGLAYVLRHGSMDLSLGAVVALGGLVGVTLADYGAGPALLAALGIGAMVGLMNGLLVRLRGLPPALATLCTAGVIGALILAYVPDAVLVEELGGFRVLASATWIGVPIPLVLVLVALVFDQYLLRHLDAASEPEDALNTTPVALAHVAAGAHAALAGALLAAADIRPGQLLQSAWHLLPFAAVCLGGGLLSQRRAPLLAALSGGALVAVPTCHVEQSGLPVLTFLVAGVALIVGSLLDLWKQHPLSELTGQLKVQSGAAAGSLCCSLLIAVAGWGLLTHALHRVPPQSAMVLKSVGDVAVLEVGSANWTAVEPRGLLRRGDRLRTGPESVALILTARGSTVKVDPGAELAFDAIDSMEGEARTTQLRVATGRVWSLVKRSVNEKTKFTIETPTAVAAVRGTAFSVVAAKQRNYVSCADGFVEVKAEGESVVLKTGTETEVRPAQPPAPPRPMSVSERNGWARERPLLERPTEVKLWDSRNRDTGYLSDSFSGASLDPVLWRLRTEPDGPSVSQREGRLQITGDVSGGLAVLYSHGIVSQSFSSRACEAAVDVMVRDGDGAAVLRLADEQGSRQGVAVVVHPMRGTSLVGPDDKKGRTVAPAKGYQTQYAHLVLRYEPAIGLVRAYCDGLALGTLEVELGESLHFELLCEGRRSRLPVDVWFDDLTTDVAVPPAQSLRMTVAALGAGDEAKDKSTLLMLQPLVKADALTGVEVTYPYKLFATKSRLRAQGSEKRDMRFDRQAGVWACKLDSSQPGDGDYIFRFTVRETGKTATKWMRLGETVRPKDVPALAENMTDSALEIRWELPAGVAGDWVELFQPGGDGALQMRDQASSPNAVSVSKRDLDGWRQAMAVVYAHVGVRSSDSQVEQWAQAVESLRPFLRPGMHGWITTSSPHGSDEFMLRCGKLWEL